MAAYATSRLKSASEPLGQQRGWIGPSDSTDEGSLLDALIDQLAERVAERLASTINPSQATGSGGQDEWFDVRHAADYLGVHRDTLRRLAAERAIPAEQNGPGCKLYFRRSDLDAWRQTGGRPRHLGTTLRRVA